MVNKSMKELFVKIGLAISFILIIIVLCTIGVGIAKGQVAPATSNNGGNPSAYTFSIPPPPPVQGVNAQVVGLPGNGNIQYAYFVIAKYNIGNSTNSQQPALVFNPPNTLTSSNYVQINWQPVTNAIAYDVIRQTIQSNGNNQSIAFNPTCTNCLIASAIAPNSYQDISNTTLGNYTLISASGSTITLSIDNTIGMFPHLNITGSQFSTLFPNSSIKIDFTNAGETQPVMKVASLPATCTVYDIVWLIGSANPLYGCTATNTFTPLNGSSGGTGTTGAVVNVKVFPFNAAGNGTTNDTAAIVSACAIAQVTLAPLYFPAGTYPTDPITCFNKAGMSIEGDGPLASILLSRTGLNIIDTTTGSMNNNAIHDIGFNGNAGAANHAIYIEASVAFSYGLSLRNLHISNQGGRAIFLPVSFNVRIQDVDANSNSDNVIELLGFAAVLTNTYVHFVGSGKSAYVFYSGNVTCIVCNSMDGGNVNATSFTIGQITPASFAQLNLYGSNIESFTKTGINVVNGSVVNLYGTQILAPATGTVTGILFGQNGLVNTIDSSSYITTQGATFANGCAFNTTTGNALVVNMNASLTLCNWSINNGVAYPTPTWSQGSPVFAVTAAQLSSLQSPALYISNGGFITTLLTGKYGCTHGVNATCGMAKMVAGTVTVATTATPTLATTAAGGSISLTEQVCSGTCTGVSIGAVTPGTSFTITGNAADTSYVFWSIGIVN
jgi:hypothetical protein